MISRYITQITNEYNTGSATEHIEIRHEEVKDIHSKIINALVQTDIIMNQIDKIYEDVK